MREVKMYSEYGDVPEYATDGSAGADLLANSIKSICKGSKIASKDKVDLVSSNFKERGYIYLREFERVLIGTGIYIELPEGYEAQIRPRSGITLKRGLSVAIGTIDSDYRGEIGIILINNTPYLNKIMYKEKIAQIVFNKVEIPDFHLFMDKESFSHTHRGEGGFGSTT